MWNTCSTRRKHWHSSMTDKSPASLSSSRSPTRPPTASRGWRQTPPKVLLHRVGSTSQQTDLLRAFQKRKHTLKLGTFTTRNLREQRAPLRYVTLVFAFQPWSWLSLCVGASVDIDLEVFVNRSTAPDLNSGKERIEEILVLHLERGKDYFISVTGNYLPSCFGTSIRSLCQMREPIQDMPAETLRKLVSGTSSIHVHAFSLCLLFAHSALRDNLSCFFASSLCVRLNTCGGVLRRLTVASWQKHWDCVDLASCLCSHLQADAHDSVSEKQLDIPKELWMMVDHLFRNAIKQVRKCVASLCFLAFSLSFYFLSFFLVI